MIYDCKSGKLMRTMFYQTDSITKQWCRDKRLSTQGEGLCCKPIHVKYTQNLSKVLLRTNKPGIHQASTCSLEGD